jgi:hypothetical protein
MSFEKDPSEPAATTVVRRELDRVRTDKPGADGAAPVSHTKLPESRKTNRPEKNRLGTAEPHNRGKRESMGTGKSYKSLKEAEREVKPRINLLSLAPVLSAFLFLSPICRMPP